MTKIIFFLILLASSVSQAIDGNWFERGNGGFVILCDQKPPQTLDLYEAVHRYKWTLDKRYETDVQKRVQYLIAKIDKHNPRRASLYEQWAARFMDESEFIPNLNFGSQPDLGNTPYQSTCNKPQQVIYQRQPDFLGKIRYTINATLWEALSPLDQAGLIMH